jgi:hypothetical protein
MRRVQDVLKLVLFTILDMGFREDLFQKLSDKSERALYRGLMSG